LAVSGSNLYLGGTFTTVGGTTRNYAAAIGTDGTLQDWNPNMDSTVLALAVSGSNLYLGGGFTTVGGTTRNYAAAIATDGTLQDWNPNMNDQVLSLAVSGSNVYIGGQFTTVGGTTRNRAAAIATDGTLQDWNPNMNSDVNALAVSDSNVYLGGYFTTAGGSARNRAAAIATDGTLQSWNPNMDSTVSALAVSGSNVYLGGDFTTVGVTTRNRAAAVGTDGTLSSTWGTGMASPTLDTSAATITRGAVVKGDAVTPAGSTPGSYKWQRCTSSSANDCSDISGGGSTGAWWGSRNADIGNRVRLKAVWDTIDSTVTAFSTITGVFTPASTSAPTINQGLVSGAPKVGTSIHSSFGVWNGYRAGLTTVTFQWQRCTTSESSSCTTNIGTNSQWYRPVAADVGNYLRVTATLTTNGQNATASSAVTNQVASNLAGRRAHTAVRHKARATARARTAR